MRYVINGRCECEQRAALAEVQLFGQPCTIVDNDRDIAIARRDTRPAGAEAMCEVQLRTLSTRRRRRAAVSPATDDNHVIPGADRTTSATHMQSAALFFIPSTASEDGLVGRLYYLRAVGRKVLWSSACVCLCALFLSAPQDISRTGSWITTKFGGWEQGVNL